MKKAILIPVAMSCLFACAQDVSSENPKLQPPSIHEQLKAETAKIEQKSSQTVAKTETFPIKTFSYHFPDGGYKNLQKNNENNIPAKFGAVMSYPQAEGKFPVVFIIHGAAPDCSWEENTPNFNKKEIYSSDWKKVCPDAESAWKNLPNGIENPYNYYGPKYSHNYMGMAYLTQELAKKWIIAVAVDANIQNNVWLTRGYYNGMENVEAALKKHLEVLKNVNSGKDYGLKTDDLKGKFDFENVGIVGHSNGGVAAYYIASENKIPNIKALAMIQPGGLDTNPDTQKTRHNTLLVRGSCDEQLGADTGIYLLEELAKIWTGSGKLYDILVKWVGHADVNTLWAGNDCQNSETPLTREKVEEIISSVVASFFEKNFKNEKMQITIPDYANFELGKFDTNTAEIIKTAKTPYQYLSPKSVEARTSTTKILDEFPADSAIGMGQ